MPTPQTNAQEMTQMLNLINDEFLMNECKTFVANALRMGVGLNGICKIVKSYIKLYSECLEDPDIPNEYIRNTLTIKFYYMKKYPTKNKIIK